MIVAIRKNGVIRISLIPEDLIDDGTVEMAKNATCTVEVVDRESTDQQKKAMVITIDIGNKKS